MSVPFAVVSADIGYPHVRYAYLFFFRCRNLVCRSWAIPLYSMPIAILSPCQHDFSTQFLAEYVAKIHNLTCTLQRLNSRKVVRSKILIQNVLSRQILTNSTAKLSPGAVNRGDVLTACFRDMQSQFEWRL